MSFPLACLRNLAVVSSGVFGRIRRACSKLPCSWPERHLWLEGMGSTETNHGCFSIKKKKRTGIVKITDEDTNKTATDSDDRARILEEYANELYQTNGEDEEVLNTIQQAPTPTSVPDTPPEDEEILAAIERVKSRKARTDTPAELWKALLMDRSKSGNMKKVLTRLIKEQYQGISKSECLSNVSAKILNKPGKSKSGLMKNKRIIVLQPFCTCMCIGDNLQRPT
jgi:hypothetical protein